MMEPNVNVFGVLFVAIGAAALSWGVTGSLRWAAGDGGVVLALLSLAVLIDIRAEG